MAMTMTKPETLRSSHGPGRYLPLISLRQRNKPPGPHTFREMRASALPSIEAREIRQQSAPLRHGNRNRNRTLAHVENDIFAKLPHEFFYRAPSLKLSAICSVESTPSAFRIN